MCSRPLSLSSSEVATLVKNYALKLPRVLLMALLGKLAALLYVANSR